MAEKKFRVPHTLVLLFGMIVLAYLLTLILPAGAYETVENEHGRQQVVEGTYAPIDGVEPLPPQAILTAVPHGFEAAGEIIFFVFIVGGAFGVFRATGAADAAIGGLLRSFGHRPGLLIAGGMLVFTIGSSTLGMAEEYIPFVPLLLALCIGLGYDAVTAIGLLCVGYGVGYGTAAINPFTVLIAQDVAGLPPTSGLWYRVVLTVVFAAIGFHHVWRYAKKVKKNPESSLVADVDEGPMVDASSPADHPTLTGRHKLVLGLIGLSIVALVVGIKLWDWYLVEMGALFLGLSIVLGLVGALSIDRTAKTFCHGAAELTTTALLIGFARAIQVVLDNGQVIDTVVHGIAQPLSELGATGAAIGMFAVQSVLNFFIPSGSGQAYVTMPIMAPLASVVGVSKQTAVLAYEFGDGFTNIVVPTNAVLVGILAMAGIPYQRWLRFILPFMVKVWVVGSIALAVAVAIGY